MSKLPAVKGIELKKFCEKLGFEVTRQKGSHVRMLHEDGRATTIPIHSNKDIPRGLLRKIIREDIKISLEEFQTLYLEL
jgi:predicted RNA binding protein YcfA (HicA-like mRNA interferase family)